MCNAAEGCGAGEGRRVQRTNDRRGRTRSMRRGAVNRQRNVTTFGSKSDLNDLIYDLNSAITNRGMGRMCVAISSPSSNQQPATSDSQICTSK